MVRVKREKGESSLCNDVKKEKEAGSNRMTEGEDGNVEGGEGGDHSPEPALPPTRGKPGASASDRRRLRSQYRALRTDVNDGKAQLAQADSLKFKEIFERVEGLHQFVDRPREQIADAELFLDITNELYDVAKGARIRGGMSPAEFIGAIIHNFGLPSGDDDDCGPKIDWEAVGMEACLVLRGAPGVSTMVGPLDVELKTRKVPISRKRDKPAAKTVPQEVEETDEGRPSTETDANMSIMFRLLAKDDQIELDRLVLNRESFAQTIENLFALSFLVKDGRVEIKIAQDGVQYVVPRNAPSHAERAKGEVINAQFVFRLDFGCWRKMVQSVSEGTEVMPHRAPCGSITVPRTATPRTPIRKNSRNRARETPMVASQCEDDVDDDSGEWNSRRIKRKLISRLAA